jgi:hypothetical protein
MEKRQYMMCPFRKGLDEDIKAKYFSIPEGKRSDALRDAFRLYMGIDKKLVYEASEKPIKQPERPPYVQKPPTVHTPTKPVINRPLINSKK